MGASQPDRAEPVGDALKVKKRSLATFGAFVGVALPCAAEPVWGPWRYAATNTHPLANTEEAIGIALSSGSESCARFVIDCATELHASVRLGTGAGFDPDQTGLKLRLRHETGGGGAEPGGVVSGTEVPLAVSDGDWLTPFGGPSRWYSADVNTAGVSAGTYWVCLWAQQVVPEASVVIMGERLDRNVHQLRWDTTLDDYIERDGLWFDPLDGWSGDGIDPFIRTRCRDALNGLPIVTDITAVPDLTNCPVVKINLDATATDIDGDPNTPDGDINYVRWSYSRDGDPTRVTLNEGAVTPKPNVNVQISRELPGEGAYRFFFDVRDDNFAWSGFDPSVQGVVAIVECPGAVVPDTTTMGEITDDCGEDLCMFLAQLQNVRDPNGNGTTITNRYRVTVDDHPAPVTDHVYFRLLGPDGNKIASMVVNTPVGNRYTAEFDMTALPVSGTYRIIASAHGLQASSGHPGCSEDEVEDPDNTPGCHDFQLASTSKSFTVLPAPCWYQHSVVNMDDYVGLVQTIWDEQARMYRFRGRLPHNPDLYVEKDLAIPLFGTKRNAGGVKMDFEEEHDLQGSIQRSADGGFEAVLLGVELLNEPFDVTAKDGSFDCPDSGAAFVASGASCPEEGPYEVSYSSPVLIEAEGNIYEGTIFRGVVDYVEFEIGLTIDYAFEASFDFCACLDPALRYNPICLAPILSPTFTFVGELDVYGGVASLKLNGEPSLDFVFPFCYDHDYPGTCLGLPENLFVNADVYFDLIAWATVCAAWDTVCWDSPNWHPSGLPVQVIDASCAEDCVSPVAAGAGSGPIPGSPSTSGPLASPRIASDEAGNGLAVWIHDGNPGASPPDPDVYYAYKPAGGSWSTPAPVDPNADLFETDPRITFLGAGDALLVFTQNQLTPTQAEAKNGSVNAIVAEQELVSYTFTAPNTWTARGKVRTDATPRADGRSELTPGPRLDPFIIWVRDPDGTITDPVCEGGSNEGGACTSDDECPDGGRCVPRARCNSDVWVKRWSPFTSNWIDEQPIAGTGTDACCAEPDIAFDNQGNALAVWVQDEDGDPSTGSDRAAKARRFDATTGWAANVTNVSDAASHPGALWPTVGFDAGSCPSAPSTGFYDDFEDGTLDAWGFTYSSNGTQSGSHSNGAGIWSSSIVTTPNAIDGTYSARLYADSPSHGGGTGPWDANAAIHTAVSEIDILQAEIVFDQIQGSGGVGGSWFQVAVINNADTSKSVRYGFNTTGDAPGDVQTAVSPGECIFFNQDVATDYFNKYAAKLDGAAIIRFMAHADYAESGTGQRTTVIRVDDVQALTSTGSSSAGRPIVVFTTRNETLPSGGEYGEGIHDFLHAATASAGVQPDGTYNFDSVEPIGGAGQGRARWPRMTIASNLNPPLAIVGGRFFTGAGPSGYDGEVGLTVKPIPSAADPTHCWISPVFFTNDDKLHWQIDVNANVTGVLQAVWVEPASTSTGAPFGQGFDGIQLTEIPLAPDLSITPDDIGISTPFPQLGEEVTVRAVVRNTGLVPLTDDDNVGVGFYFDSIEPPNRFPPGGITLPVFFCSRTARVDVTIPWPDGDPHTLFVVVNDDSVVPPLPDTNPANNVAAIEVVSVAPPADLRSGFNHSEHTALLSWTSPNVADPAAPEPVGYNIYAGAAAANASGALLVGHTIGTVFAIPNLPAGLHAFTVTAVSEGGAESLAAGPVTVNVTLQPPDGCPNDFAAASNGAGGERLSRFVCVSAPEAPAAAGGAGTAIRVVLKTMYNTSPGDPDGADVCPSVGRTQPDLAQFEGETRWVGAPTAALDDAVPQPPDYIIAPLVCTGAQAEVRDWSSAGLAAEFGSADATRVYFFGSEVVPCSVYEVSQCADPLNEATCSVPTLIFSGKLGDCWPPFAPAQGQPSFVDIGATVAKFKSLPFNPGNPPTGGPPEWHALVRGNAVAGYDVSTVKKVDFIDIGKAVDGFKSIAYKEDGPCDPDSGMDNCGNPCNTAP